MKRTYVIAAAALVALLSFAPSVEAKKVYTFSSKKTVEYKGKGGKYYDVRRRVTFEVDRERKQEQQNERSFWETRYSLDSGEKTYVLTAFSTEKKTKGGKTFVVTKKTIYEFAHERRGSTRRGDDWDNPSVMT